MFEWLRSLTCGLIGNGSTQYNQDHLTEAEILALKEVWEKAKKRDVCQEILRTLIEQKPQFRVYFGFEPNETDLGDLKNRKMFQVQACRIQNFFDTAISTLGFCPIANVLSMAHRIGQIHFYRGVNFGADDWLAFKNVAVRQITKDVIKRDCAVVITDNQITNVIISDENLQNKQQVGIVLHTGVIAWKKFMAAVIREMKRGFHDEALRNCQEESSE